MMALALNLEATALLCEQWATAEVNHCPTPEEWTEIIRIMRFAAKQLEARAHPVTPTEPIKFDR
jgi:hypothetical protein